MSPIKFFFFFFFFIIIFILILYITCLIRVLSSILPVTSCPYASMVLLVPDLNIFQTSCPPVPKQFPFYLALQTNEWLLPPLLLSFHIPVACMLLYLIAAHHNPSCQRLKGLVLQHSSIYPLLSRVGHLLILPHLCGAILLRLLMQMLHQCWRRNSLCGNLLQRGVFPSTQSLPPIF